MTRSRLDIQVLSVSTFKTDPILSWLSVSSDFQSSEMMWRAIMTYVPVSWEIFKSREAQLGYDDIKWPAKRDTLIAVGTSDWSVADTSGVLIGWFCIQTDLINLSSCDTFRVNRGPKKMMTSSNETLPTSHVLLIHLYSKMTLTYNRQTSPCKQGSQETRHRNPMNVQLLYNVFRIFCFPWPEAMLCQVRGFWCTIIQWLIHSLFLLILFHSVSWGSTVSSAHKTDSHQIQILVCAWLSSSIFIILHSRGQTIGTNCLCSFSEIERGFLCLSPSYQVCSGVL